MLERLRKLNSQIKAKPKAKDYSQYRNDPIRFGEEVLGESYTDEVKALMESVRDNEITIAISANGTGKTHSAARIACWFKLCYGQDAQVLTAAAPPENNLKTILWGEIGSIVNKHPGLFDSYTITTLKIEDSPKSFILGLTIPSSGTPAEREAKFCVDADDLFEMRDGRLVKYGDLIGKTDIPVISVNGRLERNDAIAEVFDNGEREVYEITMDDGEVIRRTENHPLYAGWDIRNDCHVYAGKGHKKGNIRVCQEGWLSVADLKPGFALLGPEDTGFNIGSDEINENILKFLAYMIGDGCFIQKSKNGNRLQFTQERNGQLAEFLSLLDSFGAPYTRSDKEKYNWVCVSTSDKRLVGMAKEWGLYGCGSADKHVPGFVFSLSGKQIAIFLSRLFATDGWASLTNKAEIGYCSKSERLARDVQRLLRRIGIRSKIASKRVSWKNKTGARSGIYWSVTICHSIDVVKFSETVGIYGKAEAVEGCRQYSLGVKWKHGNWRFARPGYVWRRVVSIRRIGRKPTVGFYVPGNHTYLTSLVEHNSGKHAPYLMFILDEGDAIPDEVYKGIESCMSGGIVVRLLIMFNPRQESGEVYRMIRDKRANVVTLSAFAHPNVVTGENRIPGAVTRDTTIRRINQWCRPLAEGEQGKDFFILPAFLEGCTAKSPSGVMYPPLKPGKYEIVNSAFSYMSLGRYPAQSSRQLISREWINAARARWDSYVSRFGAVPPVGVRPIMGQDVAEFGDDENVALFRYGGWVEPVVTWSGMERYLVANRARDEYRDRNAYRCNVDASGIGIGIAPTMTSDGCAAFSVFVGKPSKQKTELGEFGTIRDQLWWAVREWLQNDPGAMLPPDEMLIEELQCPTYKNDNRGKIKVMDKDTMREILKRSPDRADALCLTFAPSEQAFDPLDVDGCAV